MYEEYHLHHTDPASPFYSDENNYFPEDGLPDRLGCLLLLLSSVIVLFLLAILL